MSILNALMILEQSASAPQAGSASRTGRGTHTGPAGPGPDAGADGSAPFSSDELLTIARQNAQRLHRTLSALLDLASIESGTFGIRPREMELARVADARIRALATLFRDRDLHLTVEDRSGEDASVLADPARMARAVDLLLTTVASRAAPGSAIRLRISRRKIGALFEPDPKADRFWKKSWAEFLSARKKGARAPGLAFAGTLQSENAFLTREEEGLGSELLLVHEIMTLHGGVFDGATDGRSGKMKLWLELPELSSEEGLRLALGARVAELSSEYGAAAIGLVEVPKGQDVDEFRKLLKESLFRSTDAAYALPERRQVGLLLDDCKPEDAPGLMRRVLKRMVAQVPGLSEKQLRFGMACAPADGMDSAQLVDIADRRLNSR